MQNTTIVRPRVRIQFPWEKETPKETKAAAECKIEDDRTPQKIVTLESCYVGDKKSEQATSHHHEAYVAGLLQSESLLACWTRKTSSVYIPPSHFPAADRACDHLICPFAFKSCRPSCQRFDQIPCSG